MVSWNNNSLEFPATDWGKPGWQYQISCPILTTHFNSGHCTVSVLQDGWAHVNDEGTAQSFALDWGRERMPVREEGVKCRKRCQEGQHLHLARPRHISVLLNYIWSYGRKWFEGLGLCVSGLSLQSPSMTYPYSQESLSEKETYLPWSVLKRLQKGGRKCHRLRNEHHSQGRVLRQKAHCRLS